MEVSSSDEPEESSNNLSDLTRFLLSNEFGLLLLITIFAIFFATYTDGFASRFNLFALGRTMAIDIMVGFSMMVVIVTGGLNLSVGAIGVSSAMFGGWMMVSLGLPLPIGIVGGLFMGAMMGWVKGSKPAHDGNHEHSSVWTIDWEGKARVVGNLHPTTKPVEIFARREASR